MLPQRPQRGHEEVVADADDRPLHPLGLARRRLLLVLLACVTSDDSDLVVPKSVGFQLRHESEGVPLHYY